MNSREVPLFGGSSAGGASSGASEPPTLTTSPASAPDNSSGTGGGAAAAGGGGSIGQVPAAAPPAAAVMQQVFAQGLSHPSPLDLTLYGRKRRRPEDDLLADHLFDERGFSRNSSKPEQAMADYAVRAMGMMRRLRDSNLLCDVVVRTGETEVVAHRLVLAACSEYFRACLTGPMKESGQKVITLNGVDEGALAELINFAYCGRVNLHEDTVLELLVAANRLQMPQVVDQCCEFLLQRMDGTNCLSILNVANTYHCANMRSKAESFIHRHFEVVYLGEEFMSLPLDQLLQLLSSECVSVSSEEITFKAAIRWISHDYDVRSQHMLSLLKTVRLELVPTSFIADVIHQHELVQKCSEAEKLLLKAYRWHNSAIPDTKKELWNFVRKQAVRSVIYAIGGDDGHDDRNPYNGVMYLDTQLGVWHPVDSMKQKRSVCGVATLRGKVYVVGGYNGERAVESVEVFDPTKNSWKTVSSISQRRCSCGCAVLNDELYVVGGVCGPHALNEVEKYNPELDTWTRAPSMQDGRSGCGVAELGGLLYAVGGINVHGETVNSAEVFDHKKQTWSLIQSMHESRRSFGLAALGGLLYAAGGNDGVQDLNSLEVYNPLTNRWTLLAAMRHARMYCSVAVLEGKLYAVGGLDGSTTLDIVEVYDPQTNTWSEAPKLDRRICGCGLTVMDCVIQSLDTDQKKGGHQLNQEPPSSPTHAN